MIFPLTSRSSLSCPECLHASLPVVSWLTRAHLMKQCATHANPRSICAASCPRSRQSFPNSTVTFRRSPTLEASLRPRLQELSKTSALSQLVSLFWRQGFALPQVSLDFQEDLCSCLETWMVSLLLTSVTQVLWTTTEICDGNSKRGQMMKARVALLSYVFRACKVVPAFPLGSPKKFRISERS